MRSILNRLVLLLSASFFVLMLSAGFALQKLSNSRPMPVTEFEVLSGEGLSSVLNRLQEQELIENPMLLRIYARLFDHTSIKRGRYRTPEQGSDLDVLQMMIEGEVVRLQLTLVEGITFADALKQIQAAEGVVVTLNDHSDETLVAALNLQFPHPEGQLFPDTYRYIAGSSDQQILSRSAQLLATILEQEWAQRADGLPYKSPYEALIMASLIERETGAGHERGQIAGVFVRRLEKGMRLQTDPTVIYGMGDNYKGRITRKDLRTPTPWNTYVIQGLPPTPIALPGRAAIHAALHPEDGETLFFVAKGDGTHQFSVTLEEHNAAVARYQLQRRSDYRSSPAPTAGD